MGKKTENRRRDRETKQAEKGNATPKAQEKEGGVPETVERGEGTPIEETEFLMGKESEVRKLKKALAAMRREMEELKEGLKGNEQNGSKGKEKVGNAAEEKEIDGQERRKKRKRTEFEIEEVKSSDLEEDELRDEKCYELDIEPEIPIYKLGNNKEMDKEIEEMIEKKIKNDDYIPKEIKKRLSNIDSVEGWRKIGSYVMDRRNKRIRKRKGLLTKKEEGNTVKVTLEGEGEEDYEQESSTRITRRVETERKKERLKLPSIKGEIVKEDEVRQFVSKVLDKVKRKEEATQIAADMSNALQGIMWQTYEKAKGEREIQTHEDIIEIVNEMKKSCIKRKFESEIIEDLKRSGRKQGETVRMWANRVEAKLKEAGRGVDTEYIKIDVFIGGIGQENLGRKLRKKRAAFNTLKDAVETAEKKEGFYDSELDKKRETKTVTPVIRIHLDNKEYVGEIEEKSKDGREVKVTIPGWSPQKEKREYREPDNRECYNCGKTGHLARDCTGKKVIKCFKCQKTGHRAADCRSQHWCTYCNREGHSDDICYHKRNSGNNSNSKPYISTGSSSSASNSNPSANNNPSASKGRGGSSRGGPNRGGSRGGGRGGGRGGSNGSNARTVAPIMGEKEEEEETPETEQGN